MNYKEDNKEKRTEKSIFDNSRVANFADDPVGVLGWKGTGVLAVVIVLTFVVFI